MTNSIKNDNLSLSNIQEKLKDSEDRLKYALLGANDGIWDWNLKTDHVYYSPRWKSMLGYNENELEDTLQTWKDLVHKDEQAPILEKVQSCLDNVNENFSVEMNMHHKNGSIVIILSRAYLVRDEITNKPIRFVGTHVDITEQKQSENFIKKTNSILEMIATSESSSKVYNEIALIYEVKNPGMRCSLLELKDGILLHGGAPSLPKEYCEAVHGLKYGPDVGSCGTSTYTGKRVLVEDIQTDLKWSKIKQYALPHGMRSCWSEPIISSQGKVLGAFGVYHDYTGLPNEKESDDLLSASRLAGIVMQRDQTEKHLKENQIMLDEQSKLASMGEMIGNIAHQWRQPLSVISTSATGMQVQKEYGLLSDEIFQETCENINNNAQYLSKTIDDFKNFIKGDREKVEFNLSEDINSFLHLVEGNIKSHNINLILDVQNDIIINSFPNELIQCLINIFNNAKDALQEKETENKFVFITTYIENQKVILKIKDNAGGIPQDIMGKVFEAYFTTKHQSKGTGLGLHMTNNLIVDGMNGSIKVNNVNYNYNSENFTGAEFTILLPLK